MTNMWFLCMVFLITFMRLFLVKAIDCVKDVIKLNRWPNLAGVTDVKRHHLVKFAMIYGCFSLTENQIPKEHNRLRLQTISWWIKLLSCCKVVQSDSEITMTLYLDFWLMLCSREEFSFRNVYVSILEGTKQLYRPKWFKKYQLESR